MHTALHLKYRPRTLDELAGQEYVQKTLINAIESGKIAPAYLFTGSRGTGKTSTARMFAKSLNCKNSPKPTAHPCGKCQSCRSIDKSTSLDVAEIDAASNNGIDDARGLIERCSFAPAVGRYRIFILDEVHCFTSNAFNALLKCIEEPPSHVVFILCTTEAHKVLPTITSRCQLFNFRAFSITAIVEQLRLVAQKESIAITEEALVAIARTADGGLRDALQLLDQLALLEEEITDRHVKELSGSVAESDLVVILRAIKKGDVFGLLQLSRSLLDNGKTPKQILSSLLAIYRDLLVAMASPKSQDLMLGAISYSQLKRLAADWDYEAISTGLAQLRLSENQLRTCTTQPHLWLEVCLLGLIPQLSNLSNGSNNGSGSNTLLSSQEKPSPQASTKALSNKKRNGSRKAEGSHSHLESERSRLPVAKTQRKKEEFIPNFSNAATSNLTAIWNKVLEATTPNNRFLLAHAELVELKNGKAVLAVEAKYFHKFNAATDKVERILRKATGAGVAVSIQERLVK